MKTNEIVAGKTYANRGAGRTKRRVIAVADAHRPAQWFGERGKEPNEPGVLFEQNGVERTLYVSMFAQWAGREC